MKQTTKFMVMNKGIQLTYLRNLDNLLKLGQENGDLLRMFYETLFYSRQNEHIQTSIQDHDYYIKQWVFQPDSF